MSKNQVSAVAAAIISLVITLLSIFGYNVIIVQPALDAAAQPPLAARGVTNFDDMDIDTLNVTAPTAIATATPGTILDSYGAGNVILSVRDRATPVFQILNGGGAQVSAAGDYAVEAASAGQELYFRTQLTPVAASTIAAATHGISTPVAAGCSPRVPAIGGAWTCAAAIGAAGQITITVLGVDATPVAGAYSAWIMGQ